MDTGAENVPVETGGANGAFLDDSFEDWNGAELRTCSDLVYKMDLSNTTDEKVLFKIKLSPGSDAEGLNLKWPVNGIRGSLAAKETATVALLQKILPVEGATEGKTELEKLEVTVTWRAEPKKNASRVPEAGAGASSDPDAK